MADQPMVLENETIIQHPDNNTAAAPSSLDSGDAKLKSRKAKLVQQQQQQQHLTSCDHQHCQTMKQVLAHLHSCEDKQNCSFEHCNSLRRIIEHLRKCEAVKCTVCKDLRWLSYRHQMAAISSLTPPTIHRLWHADHSQTSRQKIVENIVAEFGQISDGCKCCKLRTRDRMYAVALKMESEAFSEAASLEQYYLHMAETLYRVRQQVWKMLPVATNNAAPTSSVIYKHEE